jgi:hypothetical protein
VASCRLGHRPTPASINFSYGSGSGQVERWLCLAGPTPLRCSTSCPYRPTIVQLIAFVFIVLRTLAWMNRRIRWS